MTPTQAISAALLHFIWQGAAIGVALWAALLLMGRSSPATRYAVGCGALSAMAAIPPATAWMLYARPIALPAEIGAALRVASTRAIGAAPHDWVAAARDWILPLWAFGVALFAMRLFLAWRHVTLLRRAADPAEAWLATAAASIARRMRVTTPVRTLVSRMADGPSVIGWLRPAILIPAAALAGLDTAQLEAILAHELAHIRRRD